MKMGDWVPVVVEVAAPTTTIAEIAVNLPVTGGNVIFQVSRIIHSFEQQPIVSEPTPAATVDEFDTVRARYALSLEQGLAAIPTGYRRNSTFWYQNKELTFFKGNAASQAAIYRELGMPDVYHPLPSGILVADARLSLYTILEDPDTLTGIVGSLSTLELLVRAIPASGDEILAIARAGDGFV